MRVIVVGGGAAGFFAGIHAAEQWPEAEVTILEAAKPLAKVRISGGGRCNVTTSVHEPRELVRHYPRGSKELLGPFRRFGPRDTIAWFEQHDVPLKTEADGRMFPTTDSSETIIACLRSVFFAAGGELRTGSAVQSITYDDAFTLKTNDGTLIADRLIMATGGGKAGHRLAAALGHTITNTCPSIFTFGIKEPWLHALSGLSCQHAQVDLRVQDEQFSHQGPVLITHWGLSGPAILRISAFAAHALQNNAYQGELTVNWSGHTEHTFAEWVHKQRQAHGKAQVHSLRLSEVPQRLTQALLVRAHIPTERKWSELSKQEMVSLRTQLTACPLPVRSKGVFKEEFVTAGGVARSEINWRTMESKVQPGLHFAGEMIDLDGVTGGFNFQAAWTTGHLAGSSLAAL